MRKKIIFDFKKSEPNKFQYTHKKQNIIQNNNINVEENMFNYINSVMEDKSYGIGLHSLRGNNKQDSLDDIIKNGLKLDENSRILSTVSSFGTHNKISQDYLKQQILQYSYGKQESLKQNIIVLVPSIISNSQGKQIYLGFPPYDTECAGNNYRTTCVLDSICASEKR